MSYNIIVSARGHVKIIDDEKVMLQGNNYKGHVCHEHVLTKLAKNSIEAKRGNPLPQSPTPSPMSSPTP